MRAFVIKATIRKCNRARMKNLNGAIVIFHPPDGIRFDNPFISKAFRSR